MATKSQIGAVISIEGGSAYLKTIKQINEYTKQFETEMKALTSSFDKNGKSVEQLRKQKEALLKVINSEKDKLAQQKKMMDNIIKASKDATVTDEKWATALRTVQTEINETTANINRLEQEMNELGQNTALTLMVDAWENATDKVGEAMQKVGGAMTKYLTLPIVGGLTASVKTAADFESSFTGVKKTVDEIVDDNGELVYSYDDLKNELRRIPLETASTYEQVMGIAQAAGQLGVEADQIPKFAKNIVMLGDSTNVAYGEGATTIAQFMNIVGDSTDTVDKFGSSLVVLGNKTATDEASILALATRMASASHLIGLTTPEILGLAASMSALGVTAEAGGTAISTTFQMITKSVASGDDNLKKFGEIANMSAEEFADAWRSKPLEAFQELIKGMGKLDGEDLIMFMDELGWAGIRQSDLIRRLTSDFDGVSEAVKLATDNYISNEEAIDGQNALTKEANEVYDDFNAKVSQLKESVKLFGSSIGEQLIPMLIPLVEKLTDFFDRMSQLDEETLKSIGIVGGLIAIIGPLIAVVGTIRIQMTKWKAVMAVLKGADGLGGLGEAVGGGGGGLIGKLNTLSDVMGGLIGKGEDLAGSILNTVVPALEGSGMISLGGALAGATIAYGGAYAAATVMNDKMYESAEACEYVAKRYHWSEDKVNQFGYTWTEAGHLVEMATTNMYNTSLEDGALLVDNIDAMRQKVAELPVEVASGISEGESQVQQAAFKIPMTGVEAMKPPVEEAYGYGAELAENFASGISSGTGSVESAVAGLADIVRAYIHFSEPDVGALSDFHTWMPDMMKGLADGIDDNAYLVESAISRVADTLSLRNRMSSGNTVSINNSFTMNGAQFNEYEARKFANYITAQVNENLGRMV